MELLNQPHSAEIDLWFAEKSLGLLAMQLANITYDGYPSLQNRLTADQDICYALSTIEGPAFASAYKKLELPNVIEREHYTASGLQLDPLGRPLHPWFRGMIQNPNIGVALGTGFYWNYGPNKTADPIVIRYDRAEPEILTIRRADTGQVALPGGFVDPGETASQTAVRECFEETGLTIEDLNYQTRTVYDGPLADIRATAHAWPHTTAVAFHVSSGQKIPRLAKCNNEVLEVNWLPESKILTSLFGSHSLLAQLALRK